MKVSMYTDGGARGNPGPAAIGIYICNAEGEPLVEHGETIGATTNNVAEYKALIEGLRRAKQLGADDVACFLDSELVVKQMRREYKIKNFMLQKLFDEAQSLLRSFGAISFTHLRREHEQMRRADQLVNYALDQELRSGAS